MSRWQQFLSGAFGALAVEIARLRPLIIGDIPHPPDFSATYLLFSFLFVLTGGGFALTWNDDNPVKCLYLGATWPIIVSAWLAASPHIPVP